MSCFPLSILCRDEVQAQNGQESLTSVSLQSCMWVSVVCEQLQSAWKERMDFKKPSLLKHSSLELKHLVEAQKDTS